MTEYRQKQNNVAENRNSRKPLIIAVAVTCVLSALLIVFLACKNPVFYSLAEKKAENSEFSEALELVENVSSNKGDMLKKYIELRMEINAGYSIMLSEMQHETINRMGISASEISQSKVGLSEEIISQVSAIDQRIKSIEEVSLNFKNLTPDVLSLMDVFNEVNRLLTKGPDGKNTGFTVAEERAKLANWQNQLNVLSAYAQTVPNGENVYLLTYLIREARGEIDEITEAIDSIVASGYSETDLVRFSGSGRKSFPGIQNDKGETVNFLEKERYVDYLDRSIERELAESLGEFYIP